MRTTGTNVRPTAVTHPRLCEHHTRTLQKLALCPSIVWQASLRWLSKPSMCCWVLCTLCALSCGAAGCGCM